MREKSIASPNQEPIIIAPSISVKTTGPRQWAITADDLHEAKEVRVRFERRGLRCGDISRCREGFAFLADARRVEHETRPLTRC